MKKLDPKLGIGSLVNHVGEGTDPHHAHISPIYQTSTFSIPDVETGAAIFKNEKSGYVYTRMNNPNFEQLSLKIAVLEGIDLLRAHPEKEVGEIVAGQVFSTGMAAVTTAILACVKSGQTVITHEALYGASFTFLHDLLVKFNIKAVFLKDVSAQSWENAFREHPDAALAYAESPSNPAMALVDLKSIADIAHRHNCKLMVDNTFASPYCQRPLSLGADIVLHSTTKYLSGHGLVVGGALVSSDPEWVKKSLNPTLKILGGTPSPFDTWLVNIGLKTFELRMKKHCENAMQIARFLENHSAISKVNYPGLKSHPDHELAKLQMLDFGGMLSFELKGGYEAAVKLLNTVRLITLAVSLGNTDTLIMHPASTSHVNVPRDIRLAAGITDGLVRLSVGIEDVEDLIADLDQAMK
jgi:methionine-gamma-lyase